MERSGSKDKFPRKCGKYELLERIGDGGMAEVFRARLPGAAGFEKTVVIKRILPHLAYRKQVVQMFISEAKLTAEVQHKNIVQVFELVEGEDGEFFMVMEYINGTDLRRLLKGAGKRMFRIPPWFSVHVMIEVLEALSYVHELEDESGRPRNVIHRDVSPSNIFISHLGEIKLGDFGIAKDPTQGSMTQAGQLKGKVPYMAPEQLYGEDLDPRADVFAAGVVLWECLAQRRLFGGRADIQAMRLITSSERRPPSDCIPDIPLELDAIVLDALAVDRRQRTQTARDLQSALIDVMPKLAKSVRAPEVRRVVETLLGKRKDQSLSVLAIDTDHDFAGDDTEADDPSPPSQRTKSPPPPAQPAQPHPATDLDLSFEMSRLVNAKTVPSGQKDPGATRPARPGPREEIPEEALLSVSTSNPQFSSPTADIVTESGAEGGEDAPDWLVQAPHMHNSTRAPAEVSSRGGGFDLQGWAIRGNTTENYSGPHPFWLRSTDGHQLGPLSYERMTELIKAEAKNRLGPEAKISADGISFWELGAFAAATGQEGILFDDATKLVETPGSTLGYFDERNPTSVLAWIGHERLTGKLILVPDGLRKQIYREVHVARGAPVYTYANEPALQLPEVLVQRKVITPKMVPELLHKVISTRRPLDSLVADLQAGAKYRVMLLKERITDIFRWDMGRFLFDPSAKIESGPPFARSLQSLIPELAHRCFSTDELRIKVTRALDRRLEAAPELEPAMEELGFTEAQKEVARQIAKGKKLSSLIKLRPQEEKIQLLVAYVLMEVSLLIVR